MLNIFLLLKLKSIFLCNETNLPYICLMKLKFLTPDSLDKNLKATAHKTGKLGFTVDAANKLELSIEKSASIAINEDDHLDRSLYVVIHPIKQENAYKISKAGEYYYINTKALFDNLKVDYVNDWVVYDISIETIDNQKIYKFKRREKIKKEATDTLPF